MPSSVLATDSAAALPQPPAAAAQPAAAAAEKTNDPAKAPLVTPAHDKERDATPLADAIAAATHEHGSDHPPAIATSPTPNGRRRLQDNDSVRGSISSISGSVNDSISSGICPFPPYHDPDEQPDDASYEQMTAGDPFDYTSSEPTTPVAAVPAAQPVAPADDPLRVLVNNNPADPSLSEPSLSDAGETLSPISPMSPIAPGSPPDSLSPIAISDMDEELSHQREQQLPPPPPPPDRLLPPYWTHMNLAPAAPGRLPASGGGPRSPTAPDSPLPPIPPDRHQPQHQHQQQDPYYRQSQLFIPSHRRGQSSTSTLQDHHLITLEDNESPTEDDWNRAAGGGGIGGSASSPLGVPPRCWAKRVELADYVVVKGAGGGSVHIGGSSGGGGGTVGAIGNMGGRNSGSSNGGGGLGAFVVWTIRVETLAGGTILVHKRYSEFDALRRRLVTSFPKASAAALPALPPKSLLNRFRPRFLEQRRLGLQYFLNCILLNPEFSGSPVLREFLFL